MVDIGLWLLGLVVYGVLSAAVAKVLYVLMRMRNAGGALTDDQGLGIFFSALIPIPVGMAVIGYYYMTRPQAVTMVGGIQTKAQREREQRILREREDMRLENMEHENRQAEAAFHRQRLREIEASNDQ